MREHEIRPILTQATKTNGRVGVLEKMVYLASGAVLVITPLSIWMMSQILQLKDTVTSSQAALPGLVQNAVSQAIIPYEKPNK